MSTNINHLTPISTLNKMKINRANLQLTPTTDCSVTNDCHTGFPGHQPEGVS